MAEGNVGGSSDGIGLHSEESSATVASSTAFSSAFYKVFRAIYSFVALICSSAEDSTGCASSPSDPARASSEYYSTRIQSMVERRSEFATPLDAEIDASKVHWSEVQAGNGGRGSAEANLELFRSLQEQYGGPRGFFNDWDDDRHALGEKIAEGAQGEIFLVRTRLPEDADNNEVAVLKVFKEGWSLEDLQKQWPPGMLLKTLTSGDAYYLDEFGDSGIIGGLMLNDGRFGFVMLRCWGDLRKVIDLRMQHNGNQAPPFSDETALKIMHTIASGMRGLHQDNIVHRDLKTSNVLILPRTWIENGQLLRVKEFNPTNDDNFIISIADFECSLGVIGTRFWRAPEILHGVKNRCVEPSLFTEKSDVYSYAMTCCEVLTGKIPLENVAANDYDAILLHGARPQLPSGIEPWIRSLLERCWHHDPSKRLSFEEILLEFEGGLHLKKYCWNLKEEKVNKLET